MNIDNVIGRNRCPNCGKASLASEVCAECMGVPEAARSGEGFVCSSEWVGSEDARRWAEGLTAALDKQEDDCEYRNVPSRRRLTLILEWMNKLPTDKISGETPRQNL